MRLPWNGWVAAGWSGVRRLLGVVRTDRGLLVPTLGLLAITFACALALGAEREASDAERSAAV